ncbi:LytR/AlgR family response regulator transcription factor [Chryseolinea lacunae]|uniref:Response regulator n=1 Tax=Chryseolinea lacunae TaxID=2801331 RepID=A0ABS1KPK9_9BACT|nr:response regulator [Chryseolinea lacunae]MBL0741375.1 response regulator [Chryseolinea lacunae]
MKKILYCIIVEDEPLALQLLEKYITRLDQLKLIGKCESVEEAYEAIASHHVDIVFLDLNLESVSGFDLVEKMTVESQNTYYFIITSSVPPSSKKMDAFRSDNLLLVDHLTKPFSFEQFLQSIEKVMNIKK